MWAEPWVHALQPDTPDRSRLHQYEESSRAMHASPEWKQANPTLSLSSWDVFLLLWGFPLYSVVLLPSEGSPTISSHCQANQAGSHLPAHPPPLILT